MSQKPISPKPMSSEPVSAKSVSAKSMLTKYKKKKREPLNSKGGRLAHYFLKMLLALLAFVLILLLAFPIGFYGMAMYLSPSLPSLTEIKTAPVEMPLQIYSQDNKLIGQYGNRMSLPVTYEQIPDNLIKAFLAAEDASFYEHSGISVKGLGRALTEVITHDEGQTGGSTITMQVAKNYFLTPERTFSRKLTELYLARRIEDELSKNEILTLYVNKIYMGEGAYGIKAGAKKYYSKSLEDLTIAEMATLAGLPKAPSQNNPVSNPDEALQRRNWILGRMQELGYITKAQYQTAINTPLNVHVYQEQLDVNMPYLAEMTRHALVSRYGEAVVDSGWRVKLTVNSKAQLAAETALNKGLIAYDRRHGWRGAEANDEALAKFIPYANMLPAKVTKVDYRSFKAQLQNGETVEIPWSGMSWAKKYRSADSTGGLPNTAGEIVSEGDIVRVMATDDPAGWRLTQTPKAQGSIVSLDPETGALQSLVGGFDYRHSKFNRAIQSWRQPGSTIKPLIYSAALEKGYRPDSLIADSPLKVGDWQPKNSDGRFYGLITLRRGLYLSRNLVSIRLLQSIGTADARHLLDQFGLDKEKLPTTLSLALGTGQVTPLQMATAYATFANGGHRIQPYFIDQIYNYDNKLLYLADPQHACANCFNKNIDDVNTSLQEDFSAQITDNNAKHELALEALQQHPDILTLLDKEGIDTAVTALDKDAVDKKSADKEGGDKKDAAADEDKADSTDAPDERSLSEKYGSVRNEILALTYSGSPQSDRLEPSLIQYQTVSQAPRILSPGVAYEMAGILRDVIQRGTGRRALALGRDDIGGKTGTTNEMKDAWFSGFHPSLVTVVWVGFDQPDTLGRGEYGGVAALPIWVDYMGEQLADTPKQWVSLTNKSKAEKQEQDVINLSDANPAGTKTSSKKTTGKKTTQATNNQKASASAKSKSEPQSKPKPKPSVPTKPNVTKREPPPEEPETLAPKSTAPAANLAPTRQANPLTTKKVDELPAL